MFSEGCPTDMYSEEKEIVGEEIHNSHSRLENRMPLSRRVTAVHITGGGKLYRSDLYNIHIPCMKAK